MLKTGLIATVFIVAACFNKWSDPRRSWLFISKRVTLLVDSRCAEFIEAVKTRAALSTPSSELISILGDIKLQPKFWNIFQSVNFSAGSERFCVNLIQYVK
jgi:hypothetical protein